MTNVDNKNIAKEKKKYIEIDVSDIPGGFKRTFKHFVDFAKEAFSEVFGINSFVICPNCGKKLPSNVNYCIYCGGEVKRVEKVEESPNRENHKIIRLPKLGLAIGAGAIALIIITFVVLSSLGVFRKSINVLTDDYITFQGSEGYGTAVINKSLQDESELMEYYLAESNGKADDKKLNAYATVIYNYSCEVDSENNGHLKNGDKVTVKCDYAENSKKMVDDALKTLGFKLTNTEREYTVSGLPEIEYIDLFGGLYTGWKLKNGQVIPYVDFIEGTKLDGVNYESEYDQSTGKLKVYVTNSADEIISKFNAIGELEITIDIGKTPTLVTKIDTEEDKQAAIQGVQEGFIRNATGCGWLLDQSSIGTDVSKQIQSHELQTIDPGETMVGSTYVKTTNSKGEGRYLKKIRFNMFKHEDGSYSYYFPDSAYACQTSSDVWTNNK